MAGLLAAGRGGSSAGVGRRRQHAALATLMCLTLPCNTSSSTCKRHAHTVLAMLSDQQLLIVTWPTCNVSIISSSRLSTMEA